MKILAVVGARPNFVKMAPLAWEILRRDGAEMYLVHTGQHYDPRLSQVFFDELSIPRPDVDLGVGSGSHAVQTAEVMKRFEPILSEQKPDLVLVVGDVNSTLACALVAAKLQVPVAHVEAGLRSFDESMPEELNRQLTDRMSRWLFVTEQSGVENLVREGIDPKRVHLVGNVMIDTLLASRSKIEESNVLNSLGLSENGYALLTLHRPSNVDDRETLAGVMRAIAVIASRLPVVFPVHPRTRARFTEAGLQVSSESGVRFLDPQSYLDFLKLQSSARFVLTDSGGVQEETTALGVPCLTLRDNTERPVTTSEGTSQLVGSDPDRIIQAAQALLESRPSLMKRPHLWDGKAARRIMDILLADVCVGI